MNEFWRRAWRARFALSAPLFAIVVGSAIVGLSRSVPPPAPRPGLAPVLPLPVPEPLPAQAIWSQPPAVAPGTGENLVVLAGPDRSADERAQIKTILEERKIDFQIRGDSILMTPKNRDRAILELVGEGVDSERQIFAWLEDTRLTGRWASAQQWRVAVGRCLAQLLRRSDAYQEADVHIGSEAEGRRLGEPETEAGAAVSVRMKPGETLTKKRVRAIANIVAGVVPEIKPENVTVFDLTTGLAYALPGGS